MKSYNVIYEHLSIIYLSSIIALYYYFHYTCPRASETNVHTLIVSSTIKNINV